MKPIDWDLLDIVLVVTKNTPQDRGLKQAVHQTQAAQPAVTMNTPQLED
jgi:hypothetical protein